MYRAVRIYTGVGTIERFPISASDFRSAMTQANAILDIVRKRKDSSKNFPPYVVQVVKK